MMLLGKRPRPPIIRRTTSMTGITVEQHPPEPPEASNDKYQNHNHPSTDHQLHAIFANGDRHSQEEIIDQQYYSKSLLATISPTNLKRNSSDHTIETAHFLRTCGLCKRRLSSGRDLYMYRGDTAFCSQECREQQMKQDERKEKNSSVPSSNDDRHTATSGA